MEKSTLEIIGIPTGEIINIKKLNIVYFNNNEYIRYMTSYKGRELNKWVYLSSKRNQILEIDRKRNIGYGRN